MQLFLSFDGRIGRKDFWKGIAILIVVAIAISVVFLALPFGRNLSVWAKIILFPVSLILLYPITALLVKRQHDRDKRPFPMVHLFILANIVNNAFRLFEIDYAPVSIGPVSVMTPGPYAYTVMAASMLMGLWLVFGPGLRAGTSGSNTFSPDPAAAEQLS